MAFTAERARINREIVTNDDESITGDVLNAVLNDMLDGVDDLNVPQLRTQLTELTNTVENLPEPSTGGSDGISETEANNLVRTALSTSSVDLPAIDNVDLTATEGTSAQVPGGFAPTIRATRESFTVSIPNSVQTTNTNFVTLNIQIQDIGGQGQPLGWIRVRQGGTTLTSRSFETYHNNRVTVYFAIIDTTPITIEYFIQGFFNLEDNALSRRFITSGNVSSQGVLYDTANALIDASADEVRSELAPQVDNLNRQIRAANAAIAINTALTNLFTIETITQNVPANFLVNDQEVAEDATFDVTETGTLRIAFTPAQSHAGFRIIRTRGGVETTLTPDLVGSNPQYFFGEIEVVSGDEIRGATTRSFPSTVIHQDVERLKAFQNSADDLISSDAIKLLEDATVTDISGNETSEATAYNISLSSNNLPFAEDINEIDANSRYFIINPLTNQANSPDGTAVLSLAGNTLVVKRGSNYNAVILTDATEASTRQETVFLATNTEDRNHTLSFGDPQRRVAERTEIALILPSELITSRQITFNWQLVVQGNVVGTGEFSSDWLNSTHANVLETLNIGAGNVRLSIQSITSGGQRNLFLRATPSSSSDGPGQVISNSYINFTASYTATRNIPAQPAGTREVLLQRTNAPLVIGVDTNGGTYSVIGNFDEVDTRYSSTNFLAFLAALSGDDAFEVYPVTQGQTLTPAIITSLEGHKGQTRLNLFDVETSNMTHNLTIPARVVPNDPMVFLDIFDTTSTTRNTIASRTFTANQIQGINLLYIKYAFDRSDGLDRYDDAWIDLRPFRARSRSETFGSNDSATRLQVQSRFTGNNLSTLTLSGLSGTIALAIIRGY